MSLVVVRPGLASRLVDAGRVGWRHLGVPTGGAADRASWQRGNAFLRNAPDAVALEIALAGPTLEAVESVGMVLAGAPFEMTAGQRTVVAGQAFSLAAGERLIVGGVPVGARAYISVVGGFRPPALLGSQSSLATLVEGEILVCDASTTRGRRDPSLMLAATTTPSVLRVQPGPQADWFDVSAFVASEYRVGPASDRMGIRLAGLALVRPARELVSEPVTVGTVQVLNDGQCVILGRDGQTIGGYPRVAQVIAADLDTLGQLRPGQAVQFVWVDDGVIALRERAAWLRREILRLSIG